MLVSWIRAASWRNHPSVWCVWDSLLPNRPNLVCVWVHVFLRLHVCVPCAKRVLRSRSEDGVEAHWTWGEISSLTEESNWPGRHAIRRTDGWELLTCWPASHSHSLLLIHMQIATNAHSDFFFFDTFSQFSLLSLLYAPLLAAAARTVHPRAHTMSGTHTQIRRHKHGDMQTRRPSWRALMVVGCTSKGLICWAHLPD